MTEPEDTGVPVGTVEVEEGAPTEDQFSAEAEGAEQEEGPVEYIVWVGSHYMRKGLTAEDLAKLGAVGEMSEVWWERANNFRVRRSLIPLTDEKLAWYIASEQGRFIRQTDEA